MWAEGKLKEFRRNESQGMRRSWRVVERRRRKKRRGEICNR